MEADVRFAVGASGIKNSRPPDRQNRTRLASLFADDAASADRYHSGLAENPAVAGFKVYQPKAVVKMDPSFNVNTETFGEEVTFLYEIELKKDAPAGPVELTAQVRYQCCNDTMCLPPKRKTAVAIN